MPQTAADLRAAADRARQTRLHAAEQEKELKAAADRLEREERRAKERAENEAHYDRMYEEIGQPLAGLTTAQHEIVYGKAWEDGHSSGYHEVEGHYGELAEMARKLIEAS